MHGQETVELECEHCGDLVTVLRDEGTCDCPACGEVFDVNVPPAEERERKTTMRFRRLPRV